MYVCTNGVASKLEKIKKNKKIACFLLQAQKDEPKNEKTGFCPIYRKVLTSAKNVQ